MALALAACASAPEKADDADVGPVTAAQLTPKPDAGDRKLYVDSKTGLEVEILSYGALEGWGADDHGEALAAFRRSCAKIQRLKSDRPVGGFAGGVSDWISVCEAADRLAPDTMRAFLEVGFTPVRIAPGERGLATAYFEPVLDARREPVGIFQHAVYRMPPEVVSQGSRYGVRDGAGLKPFLTRGEIDAGGLAGRGLEIAYLSDPVDLFFLHIQGSGRLVFRDGSSLRIGFAGKNGHPYASVATAMVRKGWARPGQASADFIRDFYQRDPERGRQALAANASYIFFRELPDLDADAGPVGALGVQLADGRSIAVDRRFTPLGAPVWLETETTQGPLKKLVIAQDTGSAIKGPQRLDYYWGSGEEAGFLAGRVKNPATMTMLLPNALVARLTGAGS